jgi:DNA-binding CsgD family transcriptional regulator
MIVRSRSVSYESKMVTLSGIARTLEPDRYGVSLCLEVLAWIAADPQQRHQRAATLVGAADSLQTDIGASITSYGHLVGFHLVCERQIHDALGEVPFTEAFHHGQDLTYEDAIAYALDEPRYSPQARPKGAPTPLTRREQQVADLIAEGLSNKDIAAKLVSPESHVEHILAKLGFTSRAQIAAWAVEQRSALM